MAKGKKLAKKGKVGMKAKDKGTLKLVKKSSSNGAQQALSNKAPKLSIPKTPYKQSEFFSVLAEQTGIGKKEAKGIMESLKAIIKAHIGKGGPGQFTLPGLFKVSSVIKPATKARKGRNPFTGEEMLFKAKPARKVIKIKALKKFKSELE